MFGTACKQIVIVTCVYGYSVHKVSATVDFRSFFISMRDDLRFEMIYKIVAIAIVEVSCSGVDIDMLV